MNAKHQKDRFRFVCRWLLSQGIKPTPSLLGSIEPSFVYKGGLSHSRLGQIRREEFERAGWRVATINRGSKFGRIIWFPPVVGEECDTCGDLVTDEYEVGGAINFRRHNNENYERHVRLSHTPEDAERIIREHYERYGS